jgi:mannose-1-phosphate guanylyltransferase
LLAAGFGERLRPLTNHTPKCLLKVGGIPILQHWLEKIEEIGAEEVLINTHWLSEQVYDFVAKHKGHELVIKIANEERLLGSAGTLIKHKQWALRGDLTVIVFADNYVTFDLKEILEFHRSHQKPFSLGLFESPHPEQCGIVQLDDEMNVIEFIEKPIEPKGNMAFAGIAVCSPPGFYELQNVLGNRYPPLDFGKDALPLLIDQMKGYLFKGALIDIGTPHSYYLAQKKHQQISSNPIKDDKAWMQLFDFEQNEINE